MSLNFKCISIVTLNLNFYTVIINIFNFVQILLDENVIDGQFASRTDRHLQYSIVINDPHWVVIIRKLYILKRHIYIIIQGNDSTPFLRPLNSAFFFLIKELNINKYPQKFINSEAIEY